MQHQLSAVSGRILLADADDKQKVSAMSAEAIAGQSAHMVLSNVQSRQSSVHVTHCRDCSGTVVLDLQAHGGGLVLCAGQICGLIVDSKVVVGRRRRRRTGVCRQASRPHTRPEAESTDD